MNGESRFPRVFAPRDHDAAIEWARTVAAGHDVIFLDTETTGLGPAAEIIDLAIVGADGEIRFNSLIRPYRPIPADASFVHGISNRDVASQPAWHEIAGGVRQLIEGRIVIAYNAQFDREMLWQTCQAGSVPEIEADWHCAMRAFTAFCRQPGRPRHLDRWQSLSQAARSFGVPAPTHRALADAQACREIVQRMAASVDADVEPF